MIRVKREDPPEDFDQRVRVPGEAALLELIGDPAAPKRSGIKRKVVAARIDEIPVQALPPFWTRSLPELRKRYRNICSYLGMFIDPATGAATVDHFRPKSRDKHGAYEWANFRLSSALVNTYKGEHEDVLDPFQVENGWFVLDIGSFEVQPADGLPSDLFSKVATTIERLNLNEQVFRDARAEYHDRYHGLRIDPEDPAEPWPYSWLLRASPFVASELRRQGRLRQEDEARA